MQLTNIPGKLVLPFAYAGGKTTIPVASQIGITAGAASLTDGFPPLTRTPIAAGGVPPSGLDMNGILYEMSAIIRWANAGGGYPFDGTFATDTNVGGYPKGARIMRADGTGYWFNTVENNVTDPEGAGAAAAGWVPDFTTGVAAVTMTGSSVTLTPAQYGKPVIVVTGVLTASLNLIFPNIAGQWTVINGTTGAYSIIAKTASDAGQILQPITRVICDATSIYAFEANLAGQNGSKYVGNIQTDTGAYLRTADGKFAEMLSVFDFMTAAQIADVKSETAAIDVTVPVQNAMKASCTGYSQKPNKLLFPFGKYLVKDNILCGSNIHFEFEPGVTINFVPAANNETTSLFVASNQSNLVFNGNGATLTGYRAGANPATEGNAAAFFMYGSDNVIVRNFRINDWSTDGLTITGDVTGSGPCTNVLLENLTVNNARRNGLSIIHADGCTVLGGKYTNSNGSPAGPYAGIDVEPNENQWARNVSIIGVYTEGNAGGGLLFVPGAQGNVAGSEFTVTVVGGMSYRDGALTNRPALRFASGAPTNKVNGFVSISDFLVKEPVGCGMMLDNWDATNAPVAILNNVKVVNPDYTLNASTNGDRSGFFINAATAQIVTNLGNAKFSNCQTSDTRGTPRAISCFWLQADTGKKVKNVDIVNPELINGAPAFPLDVQGTCLLSGNGGGDSVTVSYTTPKKFALAGSMTEYGKTVGQLVEATTALNVNLPPAANCIGSTYRIQTASGVNNVSVVTSGSDTIPGYVPYTGSNLVLNDGAYLEITSMGGTAWKVKTLAGNWWISGASAPGRIIWTGAAPASGTWNRGDKAFNVNAAVGAAKGWVCTVAGTPGTWVSEGNL